MRGGPPGDLYIFLAIAPHELFHREGANIFCRVPVPMTVAMLGGSLEVPTIGGSKARLKVPEGAQTGKQFRLKRKGMPQINTSFVGDMIVEARVETPVGLSAAQKKLMQQFAEEGGESNHPDSRGFFEKAKAFWGDSEE
jgi:molecular chaperone DnaJ